MKNEIVITIEFLNIFGLVDWKGKIKKANFENYFNLHSRKCLFSFPHPCRRHSTLNCWLWTLIRVGEKGRTNNSPLVIVLNYWLAYTWHVHPQTAAEKHHNRSLSPVKPWRSVSDPLTSRHLPRPLRSIAPWNVDLAFMSVWASCSVDGSIGLIERSCRNMALGWPPGIPFDPWSWLHRVPQYTHTSP